MNLIELAKKTRDFLSAEERKRKEKKKFLKHVLKKLKKHEKKLRKEREDTSNPEQRANLNNEIALTFAQRKKGIEKLKELKKPRKNSEPK